MQRTINSSGVGYGNEYYYESTVFTWCFIITLYALRFKGQANLTDLQM